MPDWETILRLVQSLNTALTQIASTSGEQKEALKTVASNQVLYSEVLKSHAAADAEFRGKTFKLLTVIVVFQMVVIISLLVKLNIKGGEEIRDSLQRVAPITSVMPK